MRDATPAEAGTWEAYYRGFDTLPKLQWYFANMGEFLARCQAQFGGPGARILEIGTGTGILAIYFSQLGYSVTGIDLDADLIAANQRLNRLWNGEARFLVGDMFHLPFASDTFDVCYHQGLMEHFDPSEIVEALKIQTAVCRKVIFAVPTLRWRGGLFGNERLWTGTHWRNLLAPFRILDTFGMAYSGLAERFCHAAGRRLTHDRPKALHRHLALCRAGEIGFVIERR